MKRKSPTPPERIDLGLAISGALLRPGETRTHREIAAFTDTSKQQVEQLEKRAMEHLRIGLCKRGINSLTIK